MFLPLFATLGAASFLFIILGYVKDIEILTIFGFAGIFMLGLTIETTGVSHQDGYTEVLDGNTTTVAFDYVQVKNHFFGFYAMIVAFFGFLSVFLNKRGALDL